MTDPHRPLRRPIRPLALLRDLALAVGYRMSIPGPSFRGPLPPGDTALAAREERLRRLVTHLARRIGERNVHRRPAALARAEAFVEGEFSRAGYAVDRQVYRASGRACANIEAVVPGGGRPEEIVVVGAHYDTVPGSPGANDNASGVAALLCLAERFAAASPARTLRFVAFANEEAPFAHTAGMGSRVYARRCREKGERIAAMLCLETIGFYADAPRTQTYPRPIGWFYPSRGDFIAFVGSTRWGRLVADAAGAFRRAEPFPVQAGALPESVSDIARSDHASFWREGYPAVMVTDTANFRYPHYHTPEDTVEKIGFDRLARVVRGLEAVVSALGRAGHRAGPCRRGRPFGNL